MNLIKKFLLNLAVLSLLITPAFAADQWDKSDPAGTENMSDIDTIIQANNESLDRLLINYRRNMGIIPSSSSQIQALAGEVAMSNAAGSIVRWRRTTSTTTITWSDIDTGSEAASTTYYIYATGDTDITGVVYKISTSSTSPSGSTYYRKLASFFNDSSSNITNVSNISNDDGVIYLDGIKGWVNFTGTGTVTINDSYNVSSISDNGTGDYTINWTTAFATANYSVVGTIYDASMSGGTGWVCGTAATPLATTSARINTKNTPGSLADAATVCVIAIGDR